MLCSADFKCKVFLMRSQKRHTRQSIVQSRKPHKDPRPCWQHTSCSCCTFAQILPCWGRQPGLAPPRIACRDLHRCARRYGSAVQRWVSVHPRHVRKVQPIDLPSTKRPGYSKKTQSPTTHSQAKSQYLCALDYSSSNTPSTRRRCQYPGQ